MSFQNDPCSSQLPVVSCHAPTGTMSKAQCALQVVALQPFSEPPELPRAKIAAGGGNDSISLESNQPGLCELRRWCFSSGSLLWEG